jgi:methionyl-tRNA formyltransferase
VRAILLTGEEPLYLPRYVESIVRERAEDVAAIVRAPPTRPLREQITRQYRMFGPRAFLRMGARFAGGMLADVLPVDRPFGRHHSVRAVARDHGIPTWLAREVNAPEQVHRIRNFDPDLLVSIVAGQKLDADLRAVPEYAVNLHGSLLPNYRGRAVAFWPLYYGDDETGVTAHMMTDEWDAGPIVAQRSFHIADDDTLHSLYRRLADCGADLACDLLASYPDGFDTRPNPTTNEDYHTLPTPEQRRAFLEDGNAFV